MFITSDDLWTMNIINVSKGDKLDWFLGTQTWYIPSSGSNSTSMSIDSIVGQELLLSPTLLTIKTVVSSSSVISGGGEETEVSVADGFFRCNCFRSAL